MAEVTGDSVERNPISSAASLFTQSTAKSAETPKQKPKVEFDWMVKPCFFYQEEYKDCKSFKARFHQYFVDGKSSECSHWKEDYDNCSLWEEKEDVDALKKVINSEKSRVRERLRSHYANDVWEHRQAPPSDWNTPLPEAIAKGYENSLLKKKAEELKNGTEKLGRFSGNNINDEESSCSIM